MEGKAGTKIPWADKEAFAQMARSFQGSSGSVFMGLSASCYWLHASHNFATQDHCFRFLLVVARIASVTLEPDCNMVSGA